MHCVLNNPRNKRQTRMVAWCEEEPASAGVAQEKEEEEEEEEMLWRLRTITAAIEWRLIIHLRSSRSLSPSLSPYQAAQSALLSTALSILRGRLGLKMGG